MIGKYVIVRCHDAGVHAGTLVSHSGRECELASARRLWRWRVKDNLGIALGDVAVHGLDVRDTRVCAAVAVTLCDVCEIIACSDAAEANISGFAVYAPR